MKTAISCTLAVLLLGTPAFGQNVTPDQRGPVTIGPVIRLGKADGGTMPAPSANNAGGLIYDVLRQRPYLSDGGVWEPVALLKDVSTAGPVDYCVDLDGGSDTGTCVCGSNACATIQGAFDKFATAYYVNHQIRVYVAAGNYAGARLWGHSASPTDVTTGAGIRVMGATPVNVTPTSGSATGTVTSVSTDSVGFHVVTVSGAGWTVNDFTNDHLATTGGTGSGQTLPIISNTATTITVSGTFSPAPDGTTTFAVRVPATVITSYANTMATATSATVANAGLIVANISAPRNSNSFVSFEDIGFSGNIRGIATSNAQGVQFLRCRGSHPSNNFFTESGNSSVTLNAVAASTGTGSSLSLGAAPADPGRLQVFNSFFTSATTSQVGTVLISSGFGGVTVSGAEIVNTSSSGSAVYLNGSATLASFSTTRLRCSSDSSNFGLYMPGVYPSGLNVVNMTVDEVTGCGTGLFMRNRGQHALIRSSTSFVSNTLAMLVYGGAELMFELNAPADTSNTTYLRAGGATGGSGGTDFTRTEFTGLCATPGTSHDCSYTESSTGTRVFITPG